MFFPIMTDVEIGFPKLGMVGRVGEIDVDVETGEMTIDIERG